MSTIQMFFGLSEYNSSIVAKDMVSAMSGSKNETLTHLNAFDKELYAPSDKKKRLEFCTSLAENLNVITESCFHPKLTWVVEKLNPEIDKLRQAQPVNVTGHQGNGIRGTYTASVGDFTSVALSRFSTLLTGEESISNIGSEYISNSILNLFNIKPDENSFFYLDGAPVLNRVDYKKIINFIDSKYDESGEGKEDFKLSISMSDLSSFISRERVIKLYNLFGCKVDEIILRRTKESENIINFHLDYHVKTLRVLLNEHNQYVGGDLVYATEKGLLIPDAQPGFPTVHNNTIPHGVTRITKGVRYAIFLLRNP